MIKRKAPDKKGKFFVYILKDKNGHYYTGYTNNTKKRIKLHNSGKWPMELVYCRAFKTRSAAMREEIRIKHKKREEKMMLLSIL